MPASAPVANLAPTCAIVALSEDPLLLEALAGTAIEGASVSTAPSADRFIDQLVANGAGIALIDGGSVTTPLKNFLSTLREQFPQLLLLLIGPAQLQTQFSAQIADGTIFRFVHKPASSQRLRLFIDAAMRQLAGSAARPAPPSGGHPRVGAGGLALVGICGVVLAAVAIAWVLWQRAAAPSPASMREPADANPVQSTEPREQPAVDAQGVRDSAATEAAAREAAARDAVAREAALEQAQRSAQGARADQLAVYVQLARKRLAGGALIEPTDDSARTYLDSAIALAPEDPEVRALSLALREALIAQFRHAVAAGDAVEAQHWLTACSNYHVGSNTLSQLAAQLQQLQSAQQSSGVQPSPDEAPAALSTSLPAAPAAPAASPAATAAATAAAPAAAAPTGDTPAVVNESSLTRVLFVPPTYPQEALARGISGWVELEFTVTIDGKVTDVTVAASEPASVFDRAASSAILRSRYRPVLRDGVPVPQRARIRVRFKQ